MHKLAKQRSLLDPAGEGETDELDKDEWLKSSPARSLAIALRQLDRRVKLLEDQLEDVVEAAIRRHLEVAMPPVEKKLEALVPLLEHVDWLESYRHKVEASCGNGSNTPRSASLKRLEALVEANCALCERLEASAQEDASNSTAGSQALLSLVESQAAQLEEQAVKLKSYCRRLTTQEGKLIDVGRRVEDVAMKSMPLVAEQQLVVKRLKALENSVAQGQGGQNRSLMDGEPDPVADAVEAARDAVQEAVRREWTRVLMGAARSRSSQSGPCGGGVRELGRIDITFCEAPHDDDDDDGAAITF